MEGLEKEIGRFIAGIVLFRDINGNVRPEFSNRNVNVSQEVIITQLRAFIKKLEGSYNSNFKDNTINISGSPEE